MNTTYLSFGFAALVASAAACGGSVVTGTGGSGAGTTGTGTTTSTSTSSSGGSPCPANPVAGMPCSGVPAGFRCTYGTSTRPDCRDAWACTEGVWTSPHSACSMSTGCGTTQPTSGTVCSMDGSVSEICSYGDAICLCDACGDGPCMAPPIQWQCAQPPTAPGCPAVVPNDGTPCPTDGVQCTYGFVCSASGAQVTCTNGLWLWNTMIACGG